MYQPAVSESEPPRGYFADPAQVELPGIERLRAYVYGDALFPAFHHLTGIRPVEASYGRSTFAFPATAWITNAAGIVPAGALAFLTDAPLTNAVTSVLGPGLVATTAELSLNFLRVAFPGPGTLVSRARLVDAGSQLGLATADVPDQTGRLVAHATTRF